MENHRHIKYTESTEDRQTIAVNPEVQVNKKVQANRRQQNANNLTAVKARATIGKGRELAISK